MKYAFLVILMIHGFAHAQVEMAITVDDLPAAGFEHPTKNRTQLARDFLDVLKAKRITGVYGFMNGILAEHMQERMSILKQWKSEGHLIGNHTFSHLDLSAVPTDNYLKDLERNESILIDFATSISELKVFRYPFLIEGESNEKRYGVRSYLLRRGYRIAQVTVDFGDWKFNDPYIRCVKKGDAGELRKIEDLYISQLQKRLHLAKDLATRIYKRPVKHILLIHLSAVTSQLAKRIFDTLEAEKVKFISLDEALKDPIYSEDSTYTDKVGVPFLNQQFITRKLLDHKIDWAKLDDSLFQKFCP